MEVVVEEVGDRWTDGGEVSDCFAQEQNAERADDGETEGAGEPRGSPLVEDEADRSDLEREGDRLRLAWSQPGGGDGFGGSVDQGSDDDPAGRDEPRGFVDDGRRNDHAPEQGRQEVEAADLGEGD